MIYARRGTQHHRRRAAHCAEGRRRKLTALPDFLSVRERVQKDSIEPRHPTQRRERKNE